MVTKLVSRTTSNVITIAVVIAVISIGIGTGLFAGYFMANRAGALNENKSTAVGRTSTYHLDLMITAASQWNSTTTAPRYYVLTPNGLESSANISLPSHTLIQILIIDYDTPSPLPAQYAQVSGTVGNVVYIVNGTAAASNFTNSSAIAVGSLNPNSQVSHTFTITQLGINIPVAGNSTEIADFYINQTGNFAWQCEDPCGFGPSGWLGPMSTPGWMMGNVTVN